MRNQDLIIPMPFDRENRAIEIATVRQYRYADRNIRGIYYDLYVLFLQE